MSESPCFESVSTLAWQIAAGERSPVEVLDAYVERIEALDGHYRAYLTRTFEAARARAIAAERAVKAGAPLGALHGVPVAVKDLFDTAGVRTTCGSRVMADNVPTTTATAVERLERAGAIVLGKLHMTEFAGTRHHPDFPPPQNPYDASRSTGGSSSGSAVAVVARLCGAALGSDTVASIRLPAAWSGCVGLKPSYGRVSRSGVFPLAGSLDHVGPLARSVRDAALVLGAIAGHDPRDPTSLRGELRPGWPALRTPGSLRVGYDEAFVTTGTFPAVSACVGEALTALEAAGARVVPVTIPMTGESIEPFAHLFSAEVAAAHRALFPARADDYGPDFRGLLEQSSATTTDDLVRAQEFRVGFRDAIGELFTRVDVLITPVTPLNAPPMAGNDIPLHDLLRFCRYTYLWNLVGAPALALPWGLDADGLPNAVQIIGPVGGDERVLSVAAALERPLPRPANPVG